ncbi:NAD-binding protein [Sulfurimonas sp. SAG-AH-194-C21]|nr:NAD-binding protein [Sulfurimonas sp. SAG-AH-194-C21]MDF1883627.1 NAD-binding protein [Sulfurimonas sp. SAG-AH-194-C21]
MLNKIIQYKGVQAVVCILLGILIGTISYQFIIDSIPKTFAFFELSFPDIKELNFCIVLVLIIVIIALVLSVIFHFFNNNEMLNNKFLQSRNKIYYVIQHKGSITALFAMLTIGLGTYGYYDGNASEAVRDKVFIHSITKAFALLGLNFPSIKELNCYTFLGSVSAIVTVALTAVLFFFKEQINKLIFKRISKKKHVGVFGLGQISRTFLADKGLRKEVIIIEQNEQYADEYRAKGFGVKIGDAFNKEFLEKNLDFKTMEYALIAFGDDKTNIEFAKKVITVYKKKKIDTPIKLIVHINDKNLATLFSKSFILDTKSDEVRIDIKTFSYFEECARDLFEKYSIDGESLEYMQRTKTLNTIVCGDGQLIKRVVYRLIALSHFPNENRHSIKIVHKNAQELLEEIKAYVHYGYDEKYLKFPAIELEAVCLDYNKQEFYTDRVWKESSSENIIICYEDEGLNIKLGTTLHSQVFLADIIDSKKVPKIIMGVFDELELSDSINANKCEYRNMFTFGSEKDIVNVENLQNETIDSMAKLIHAGYGTKYDINNLLDDTGLEEVDTKWFNIDKLSDKLSNISQARHIDVKLKALNLKKVKYDGVVDKEKLLEENRALFDAVFRRDKEQTDEKILEASFELEKLYDGKYFEVKYWPDSFDTTLFDKLLNMEHNRWIAHHYLEGWAYAQNKNKDKKEHDCLIPLAEFAKDSIKITAIFDMYSFLYLPNYLAQTGYSLVPYTKTKKLGVTGHRKNVSDNKALMQKIEKEIEKLKKVGITQVISPLAQGADRVVAKAAVDILGAELFVPMPFKQQEYEKDFDKTSKAEFRELLSCMSFKELSDFEDKDNVTPIYDEKRNDLYQKCGEYVVDNCDILIAVWDGKDAKSKGGTGDIVDYAEKMGRKVIKVLSD